MDRAICKRAGEEQYRMGLLAIQEDGRDLVGRLLQPPALLGRDCGLRENWRRHRQLGKTDRAAPSDGSHPRGICGPAQEHRIRKLHKESRIPAGSGTLCPAVSAPFAGAASMALASPP